MNKLYVGLSKYVELPKGGCLLIDDEARDVKEWRHPRVFDPSIHCFNPLQGMTYKRAREIASVLYTISAQGEDTLTVRNGKRALARYLLKKYDSFAKLEAHLWAKAKDEEKKFSTTDAEVLGVISDLMLSPVLKNVFCGKQNFSFNKNSVNMARLNRAELGDDDAFVLGAFLMAQFDGQIVIPSGDFYLRDVHTKLIREKRLIIGVNFLNELSPKLRRAVMLMEKIPSHTTYEDAEELAKYMCDQPKGTDGYDTFIKRCLGKLSW
jgi:hypothetical protein